MARKIKTRSPGVKGRATIDLCKIDTARLRSMSTKQLETVSYRVGRLFDLPKKETGTGVRWLFASFVSALVNARKTPVTERDVSWKEHRWEQKMREGQASYIPPWGAAPERKTKEYTQEQLETDMAHHKRVKDMYESMANETEREIWNKQQKAGCKIRDTEIVARDAERQGDKEAAAKLRAESRGKPTPHKRPAKIR
jgi:hypothetical protein